MTKVALLEIRDECAILAAVDRIALRHSQLDYVLRLILKDAGDLEFSEAMRDSELDRATKLRERVRKCIKDRVGEDISKLDRLLGTRKNSERRQERPASQRLGKNEDGELVMRGDDKGVHPCPSVEELNKVADTLATLVTDFNEERLRGFIQKATGRKKKSAAKVAG
jgi:hypothetical protein